MEIKEKKYWLGPSSWPQWLLAWIFFAILFNKAAKKHDIGYAKGGNKKDKELVDTTFGNDMANVCNWNIFAWILASFYYSLVENLGHRYFNWSNK